MRRKSKVDDNQKVIVEALRAVGCSVQSLASTGAGVPDLLVGRQIGEKRLNFLLEVKNVKGRNRMTKHQIAWHADWRGQVATVRNVKEALRAVGFGIQEG